MVCTAVPVGSFSDFLLSSFLISLYSRLSSLPETPAAIDWSYYRSAVANAGMVDDFEKKVRLFLPKDFMMKRHDALTTGGKCVLALTFALILFP